MSLERAGETRDLVEAYGVGHFLGEGSGIGELFACALYTVAQQMLAEAHAAFLSKQVTKPGRAQAAQGSNVSQRDFAFEMRRHVRHGEMRFALLARAIQDRGCLVDLRRKPDVARWAQNALPGDLDERADALAELAVGHRLYQQISDLDA